MKKERKGLIILVTALSILVAGIAIYIICDKVINRNKEDNKINIKILSIDKVNIIKESPNHNMSLEGEMKLSFDEEEFISVALKGYCIGENNEKYTMTGPVPETISYNNNDTKFYLVNTINNENGDVIYTNGTTKYSSEINWNNVRIKSCKIEKMIAYTKESNGEISIEKELNFEKEFK